jgi:hypothetical protein
MRAAAPRMRAAEGMCASCWLSELAKPVTAAPPARTSSCRNVRLAGMSSWQAGRQALVLHCPMRPTRCYLDTARTSGYGLLGLASASDITAGGFWREAVRNARVGRRMAAVGYQRVAYAWQYCGLLPQLGMLCPKRPDAARQARLRLGRARDLNCSHAALFCSARPGPHLKTPSLGQVHPHATKPRGFDRRKASPATSGKLQGPSYGRDILQQSGWPVGAGRIGRGPV